MTTTTQTEPTTTHGVEVGQFFLMSWGYDQTNADFFKVVGVTKASVRIQPWNRSVVNGRVIPGDKPATVVTYPGCDGTEDYWDRQAKRVETDAPIQTKRVRPGSDTGYNRTSVYMTSYADAYLWDGTPAYDTRAAGEMGH